MDDEMVAALDALQKECDHWCSVANQRAVTIAADDLRIAELEAALVQCAIPMGALLIAEASFPFLAPPTITRLEVALRSINKLLPTQHIRRTC